MRQIIVKNNIKNLTHIKESIVKKIKLLNRYNKITSLMEARMYNLKLNSKNSTPELDLSVANVKPVNSDNDLMYLFSNEKRIRFENDVLNHLDALYTTALKLTDSTEDAESLIQKTLLNAFNSYINFTGPDFKLWLLDVLTNTHCLQKY